MDKETWERAWIEALSRPIEGDLTEASQAIVRMNIDGLVETAQSLLRRGIPLHATEGSPLTAGSFPTTFGEAVALIQVVQAESRVPGLVGDAAGRVRQLYRAWC